MISKDQIIRSLNKENGKLRKDVEQLKEALKLIRLNHQKRKNWTYQVADKAIKLSENPELFKNPEETP